MRKSCLSNSQLQIVSTVLLTLALGVPVAGDGPQAGEDCRSPWGAGDQRGAANRLTPAKTLEGAALIREGRVYQLGRPHEVGRPLYGARSYTIVIAQMRGPLGGTSFTRREASA